MCWALLLSVYSLPICHPHLFLFLKSLLYLCRLFSFVMCNFLKLTHRLSLLHLILFCLNMAFIYKFFICKLVFICKFFPFPFPSWNFSFWSILLVFMLPVMAVYVFFLHPYFFLLFFSSAFSSLWDLNLHLFVLSLWLLIFSPWHSSFNFIDLRDIWGVWVAQ